MNYSIRSVASVIVAGVWLALGTAQAAVTGAVVGWGNDMHGQTSIPLAAQGGVTAIASAGFHNVALKSEGNVLAWGWNQWGQTDVPSTAQNGVVAIAAGVYHTVALKHGSVIAWGAGISNANSWPAYGQSLVPVAAQSGVAAIAAGDLHTVALKSDGSVIAWGWNFYGQTDVPPAAQSQVVAVAAGEGHTVALKADGSVLAWGWNDYGQTTVPVEARSGVTAIAAGAAHTVALKTDGSVIAWGYNAFGQTTVPVEAQSGVIAIAAGDVHTLALKTNGNVVAWGRNAYGESTVPDAARSGAIAIAAGESHSAALVVPTLPVITTQPLSQSVLGGQSAQFTVRAAGFPLSYQWFFNDSVIQGATLPSLALQNVTSNDAGGYSVVVSNLGSVTSLVATLTVNYVAPVVSVSECAGINPAYAGQSVTLCANASGSPFPRLQWQLNGTNLPGATNATLRIIDVQATQSGEYTVIATNAAGMATSGTFSLNIVPQPPVQISYYFNSPPFEAGSFVVIYASIILDPPYTLRWRLNDSELLGENQNYLDIHSATAGNVGSYTLIASNSSGVYTSAPLALTIYFVPPEFRNFVFYQGSADALFQNDVTLCGQFTSLLADYQWRFNGTILPAQTNNCLTLLRMSNSMAGAYTLVASNPAGVATSSVQTITVRTQSPVFSLQPHDVSAVEGSDVRISTFAQAGPPPGHVLQFNGANTAVPFTYETNFATYPYPPSVAGGFTLLGVTPADMGSYRVLATNMFGTVVSTSATLTVTSAGPLDRWTQRNPLPQSQTLYSVCHGTNQFVTVGDRGTIMTSPNGTNWTVQSRRVDLSLQGITYGAGLFVAVGEGGTVLSSSNGSNWTYRSSSPSTIFHAVAYGNGRFVTIADMPISDTPTQPFVLTSTNGIFWEKSPGPNYLAERGIAFGGGTFVAVGRDAIVTSSNGVDWSVTLSSPFIEFECVAFLNNQFVAAGDDGVIMVSSDGVSWTPRSTGTTRRLQGLSYGNGRYVAVGARGTVISSADTIGWVAQNSGSLDRLETIDFAAAQFVALGENGTTLTSSNGTTWTKQSFGVTRDLDGMAGDAGMIVIVGKGGTILTSTDGTNYTSQNATVTNDLHGVGCGNGLWVAVGEPGVILTSTNAVHWTSRTSGTTNSLKAAKWLNERWIAVGTEGTVVTSSNGRDWTVTFTSPSFDLNDIAFGNGSYLIAADGPFNQNGALFASSNAITWAQKTIPWFDGKNLRGITFANGIFLITANDGRIVTTSNGIDFSILFVGGGNLRAALWSAGVWIVVGNGGTILTSSDLKGWARRPSRAFENLHQVIYLNGRLVTIGNRGTILQSDRFVTELDMPSFAPGIGLRLPFRGVLNARYDVQATTNLLNWNTIATFTNLAEYSIYTDANASDANASNYRLRMYRLVAP